MKFIFYRDQIKRQVFKKFEVKRYFIFSFIKFAFLPYEIRNHIFIVSQFAYPKYSNKFSFKNRCSITNRGRSVRLLPNFNPISRQMVIHKMNSKNHFPFKRSSW